MKILCEVPLEVKQFDKSQFRWLRAKENYLFAFENERRLRMFSIKQDDIGAAQEIQSASLAESRNCSCLSWNKDESLLALVVDRKQIYLWDVKRNHFSHFKPRTGQTTSSVSNGKGPASSVQAQRKAIRTRDIEYVVWSRMSDKLAICYASGQILLCRVVVAPPNDESSSKELGNSKTSQQQQQRSFTTTWERFIDNSESLLKKIASIEVSEHAELFACFSIISEILIMSFDGQTKFYCQGERANLFNAKFSPLNKEYCPRSGKYLGQSLHLACQSENDRGICLKKISLDMDQELQDVPPKLYVPRDGLQLSNQLSNPLMDNVPQQQQQHPQRAKLVDFHWLTASHLMLCLDSGSIQLIQIVQNSFRDESTSIFCTELFRINAMNNLPMDSGLMTPASSASRPSSRNQARHRNSDDGSIVSERSFATISSSQVSTSIMRDENHETFKLFELIKLPKRQDCTQCFALAATTNYKLFYYELYEISTNQSGDRFTFEHFDDIDLSDSLRRVQLGLERASWSQDCSMLSLQVTSGHLLIYKTRLQNFMVASYGPRTAYLSSSNEVTILNFGISSTLYDHNNNNPSEQNLLDGSPDGDADSQTTQATKHGDNAILLNVQLKPSLLAIGPKHLALALNNRVRLYPLEPGRISSPQAQGVATITSSSHSAMASPHEEEEYITIVVGISLSSRFVAVQFDDGRLKLHSIAKTLLDSRDVAQGTEFHDDERFFPDPSQPEVIAAFTLTEELLVYCTDESKINVFSLASWTLVQTCDHSCLFVGPVSRLKPNECGNKFVCLVSHDQSRSHGQDNVFLYDLYSNKVFPLLSNGKENNLWPRLAKEQINSTLEILTFDRPLVRKLMQDYRLPTTRPSQSTGIVDAIWDTDGRTLLLVELKSYHVLAILCHTLGQEAPIAEYAASAKKPASYTTLYISQGVVSFQTGSGRVINSILETHDDELKLTRLESQVQAIKQKTATKAGEESPDRTNRSEHGNDDGEELMSGRSSNLRMDRMAFLEAHLRVAILKLEYLCSILPIYSLPKCRDICKHLMEEESFNLTNPTDESFEVSANEFRLINQLLPKLLAAWSLYTLNLNFASLVYRRNNLQFYDLLLQALLNDIKTKKMDSRLWVKGRILSILGCDHDKIN